MMSLKIASMQLSCVAQDIDTNLDKAKKFLNRAKNSGAHLAIFPEMFFTGFQWDFIKKNPQKIEKLLEDVSTLAKQSGLAIFSGQPTIENNAFYNSLVAFDKDGSILESYHKTHLFFGMEEPKYLSPGTGPKLVTIHEVPIGLAICYDLRFASHFFELAKLGAKACAVIAGFPHPRSDHWRTLLKARALDYQMAIVSANRIGHEKVMDYGDFEFFGYSSCITADGKVIAEGDDHSESIIFSDISVADVNKVRDSFPLLKEKLQS